NGENGITPKSISKSIQDILVRKREEKRSTEELNIDVLSRSYNVLVPKEKKALLRALEEEMFELAKNLEFERAAVVRDEIRKIKEMSPT
ncbi:MAG: UvrB/UvrC motif-containing protein, partial [Spirochaetia bacterium]